MKNESSTDQFGHPSTNAQHASVNEVDRPLTDIGVLHEKLEAQQDVYLRLAADFANFKKRTTRDSKQLAEAQKEAFIYNLLPVVDNLERALASENSHADAPFRQGVEMTLQQLGRLLHESGVEVAEAVGQPFDAKRHEALSVRSDSSQPDHVVLGVAQRGYTCYGRVFRPAQVIVNSRDRLPSV